MRRFLSILLISLMLFSCGDNKDYGSKKEGIRIISLAPSLTKELVDLGLKDNIVGATSYCDITKGHKELIVGDAMSVSIEKIMLLKPDIVFTTILTKAKTIQTLRNNGIDVDVSGKMTSFKKICSHFEALADRVNKRSIADSIIKISKLKINSLIASIPEHKDSLKVMLQIGVKPIFAVTPNSFMADYITLSGCENIMDGLDNATITREAVLEKNPDVIFVVTMGVVGKNEKDTWLKYKEMNASKHDRIFALDARVASTPTVKSFTKALELVINKIYRKQ